MITKSQNILALTYAINIFPSIEKHPHCRQQKVEQPFLGRQTTSPAKFAVQAIHLKSLSRYAIEVIYLNGQDQIDLNCIATVLCTRAVKITHNCYQIIAVNRSTNN